MKHFKYFGLTLLIILLWTTGIVQARKNMLQPYGTVDVTRYGIRAKDAGTTTTVSSWDDADNVVVANASSFRVGDYISIERAVLTETIGTTDGIALTTLDLADATIFNEGDYVWVTNGIKVMAQVHQIIIKAITTGDIFAHWLNGTYYSYTVQGGDAIADVATGLAGQLNGAAGITVGSAAETITITADSAGTAFTWKIEKPYGIGSCDYAIAQHNIIQRTYQVRITQCDGVGGDTNSGNA